MISPLQDRAWMYEMSVYDAPTFAAVSLLLCMVALVASWLPARVASTLYKLCELNSAIWTNQIVLSRRLQQQGWIVSDWGTSENNRRQDTTRSPKAAEK
jgi:hypothetical protein